MIVLIDSGNSRIKLGALADTGSAARIEAAMALDNTDLDGVAGWLSALAAPPSHAIGVNVAGQPHGDALTALFARHGVELSWLRAQHQAYGLNNRYRQPEQLGADRWASLVGVLAGRAPGHTPFLLASFGTATTLDTVSAQGDFEGGLILPGTAMMRSALASGTANLPLLVHGDAGAFPTDTHAAIASGVAAAQAGALLRQWLQGYERYGVGPDIFVAGGGWPEVAAETQRLLQQVCQTGGMAPPALYPLPHPVLDGLARMARDLVGQHALRRET